MAEEARSKFKFHIGLLVVVFLIIAIVDTHIVPFVFFRDEREPDPIPIEGLAQDAVHPYHFWVMGVLFYLMVVIVASTYYRHTKKMKGTLVLVALGLIFSLTFMEDTLYFWILGQPIPENYTWMYQVSNISGTNSLVVAGLGTLMCIVITWWYLNRRRLD